MASLRFLMPNAQRLPGRPIFDRYVVFERYFRRSGSPEE